MTAAVPVFASVTVCAVLVLPACAEKVRVAGATVSVSVPPEPLRLVVEETLDVKTLSPA